MCNENRLKGKLALITGATSGIGNLVLKSLQEWELTLFLLEEELKY